MRHFLLAFFFLPPSALTLPPSVVAAPIPKELRGNDQTRIQGRWQVIQRLDDGKDRGTGVEECFWTFEGKTHVITNNSQVAVRGEFTLDADHNPKRLELIQGDTLPNAEPRIYPGLYEIDGDRLVVTIRHPGEKRPESLDNHGYKIVFKRVKE